MSIHVKHDIAAFDFRGKTLTADIDVYYTHEFEPETDGLTAEQIEAFQAGELQLLRVEVEAKFHGFAGNDVANQVQALNNLRDQQVLVQVENFGMVERALDNLRERIKETLKALEAA